jgi:phenylacetate-CoA ligase
MADSFYDDLEARAPEQREQQLFTDLPAQIAYAKAKAPYFAQLLAEVDPAMVTGREALARLPVTRKSDLIRRQPEQPPFGGLNTVAPGELARIFASPGPIYDPEPHGSDPWRFARALHATGFRKGDILHNCFSYHLTPAGSMFETGAHALGCAVIPAGTGNSEQQVAAIAHLRPRGYAGTPDFLKILLEKAESLGADLSSLRLAHVTGGAFTPDLKAFYKDRGIDAYQSYGTADLGLVAYETSARDGLVIDEGVIVEIVRPGTGDPVPDGEVGEVIVTSFGKAYPLIRFATGDLSAIMPGISACGRTNRRLKGWMGRADQTTKVKGMFVHPHQLAELARRHPEILRTRLVVTREGDSDAMILRCETAGAPDGLIDAIGQSLQAVCNLRGKVELCPPGSLPNDGKVIEDARP